MTGPYSLLQHLVRFARQLRLAGLATSPAAAIDLCQALEHIDIARRDDVRAAARATLVRDQEHLKVFEDAFDAYWMPGRETPDFALPACRDGAAASGSRTDPEEGSELLLDSDPESARDPASAREERRDAQPADYVAASLIDVIAHRDLGSLDEQELRLAHRHVREMVRGLANRPGRRYHLPRSRRGELDLRASLRRSLRHGFDAIEIAYRRRRIRKLRLLLLCDVSGSMARYSSFFLAFMQALSDELPDLEAAVFGTRLTPITGLLHQRDPVRSLAALGTVLRGWGSGTDIGRAIGEFNERFAHRMVRSRTVVVILSDGWDRGDPEGMRAAMAGLRGWVDSLVWLNPLLGQHGYQPLCRGMRTALPYLDHFLPAHNLASLANVVARLRGACHAPGGHASTVFRAPSGPFQA